MKLFNLLKNKTGKLVIGGTQLAVLTVGAAGLLSSAMFQVGTKQGETLAARSISSISSSYNYDGLNRRADGMLSSMNIQNREGGKGVAVGADRERLEGNASKNDFGLAAADNLGNRISVPGTGTAAATSATDGLGTGGVDMVEVNANSGTSRASAPGVNSAAAAQGAYGAAASGASANSGGQLASASVARASGSSFNASFGSGSGSSSAGNGGARGGSSASGSGSEGYNFSGAMPSGSNVVSSYTSSLSGRGNGSTFMAGGRTGTVSRGRRSLSDKNNDLKDISKRSADVAKNAHRSSNEGSRAFLASSQNSGGMSIEGGTEGTTTGSADFANPTKRKLKAVGDWGDKEDAKAKERSKDRNNLIKLLMGAFFATVVAIPFGHMLITKGRSIGAWGIALIIAGCALIAAALAISIWAIVAAGQFAGKWGGSFVATLTGILGGVCVAALGLALAAAFSNQDSKFAKFIAKFIPGAKSLAIGQIVSKGGELVQNEVNKEVQRDSQKGSSKKK